MVAPAGGEEAEAGLGERDAGWDSGRGVPLERGGVGIGRPVEIACRTGVEPFVIACRRQHGAVVVRPCIASTADEGSPLGRELRLPAAIRERREEAGLGGDHLVHAELVEQPQTPFDVPVRSLRVVAQLVEDAEDVLDAAGREPVAAASGEGHRRLDRRFGASDVAEHDSGDRVRHPHDSCTVIVAETIEDGARGGDERVDFVVIDRFTGGRATSERRQQHQPRRRRVPIRALDETDRDRLPLARFCSDQAEVQFVTPPLADRRLVRLGQHPARGEQAGPQDR